MFIQNLPSEASFRLLLPDCIDTVVGLVNLRGNLFNVISNGMAFSYHEMYSLNFCDGLDTAVGMRGSVPFLQVASFPNEEELEIS